MEKYEIQFIREKSKASDSRHIFVFIIGSIVMIFPFIWMLLTSFKTVAESMQIPPDFFPAQWIIDNFKDAMASLPFGALYKNTILLIFWRVVCAVAFSSMAGYAFAKLNFKGKNFPLLPGSGADDASLPDLHYAPVSDAGEDGTDQYDFCPGIPGSGKCFRYILLTAGLHGNPR